MSLFYKFFRAASFITAALLCSVAISPVSASASAGSGTERIGMLAVSESGSNWDYASTAFALNLGESTIIYTTYKYAGDEAKIVFVTKMKQYTPTATSDGFLTIEPNADDPAVLDLAKKATEGEDVLLCYYNKNHEYKEMPTKLGKASQTEEKKCSINDLPSDAEGELTAVLNNSGEFLGIVLYASKEARLFAEISSGGSSSSSGSSSSGGSSGSKTSSEENPSNNDKPAASSSGNGEKDNGTNMTTIIVIILVVGLLVGIILRQRRKQTDNSQDLNLPEYETGNPEFETGNNNMSNDNYGETVPLNEAVSTSVPGVTEPADEVMQNSQDVFIVAEGGSMDGRIYKFNGHEMLFGRASNAAIRFHADTKGVSREHCKLILNNGQLALIDMNSSYGTFVDGIGKITPYAFVPVKKGDAFYLGNTHNKFIIK